ncbi:hypothetical protein N865_07255 [Intrasporangium oryzae NRRL B-24470]|uniref:Peptidase M20 dimerisation domain-containing protein n=1 Tax=Intrasporangium oryzae NRRL B-24470 TaxID=1386089 RepID=W9GA27_9MICO|nr:M20 family metallopeptidase [Intrasporangium oryzae]EWT02077.1 hypothetical protein N865_07255 [Intrasporangium oryzae NRRL B-24470]
MSLHTTADPSALLLHARDRQADFVRDLAHLVSIDSGSRNAAGVDRVGSWAADRLRGAGFDVARHPAYDRGGELLGHVVVGRRAGSGGSRVMVFAHLDTVFADGTAAARPFRVEGTRALGPGVSDDKGGLLAGLYAVDALDALGGDAFGELVVVLTPDEEIGAPGSAALLRELAAECDVALCLECARENGDLVGARKGVADLHVTVSGQAAHSGVEPDRGASAAVEAARVVLALAELDRTRPGLTVNVGVVRAGTRPNVVASEATVVAEVRGAHLDDIEQVIEAARTRISTPGTAGTRLRLDVRDACPPLEWTEATGRLVALAREVGSPLGIDVRAAVTGGVSDANIVAAAGCPTLDGLGPIGGDDHSESEWLDLSSVAPRIALLAGLIARLGAGPTN